MKQNKNLLCIFRNKLSKIDNGSFPNSVFYFTNYFNCYPDTSFSGYKVSLETVKNLDFFEDGNKIYTGVNVRSPVKYDLPKSVDDVAYDLVEFGLKGHYYQKSSFMQKDHEEHDIPGCDIRDTICYKKIYDEVEKFGSDGVSFCVMDFFSNSKLGKYFLTFGWFDFDVNKYFWCSDSNDVKSLRAKSGWRSTDFSKFLGSRTDLRYVTVPVTYLCRDK